MLIKKLMSESEKLFVKLANPYVGLGKVVVIEYYRSVADKAVLIEHTCEGLGEYRLTGARLTNDSD